MNPVILLDSRNVIVSIENDCTSVVILQYTSFCDLLGYSRTCFLELECSQGINTSIFFVGTDRRTGQRFGALHKNPISMCDVWLFLRYHCGVTSDPRV